MLKGAIHIQADPLGDVHVEWKLQLPSIQSILYFPLPYFKYEMPSVLGAPLPLSSIATELNVVIHSVTIEGASQNLPHKVVDRFGGNRFIEISVPGHEALVENATLTVQFTVKKMVTRDRIFFSFVYAILSPFANEILIDISVRSKPSYHISSYKIKLVYINPKTGRIDYKIPILVSKREGDFIYATAQSLVLRKGDQVDVHLHSSRIPFFVDRRVVWIIISLIIIGLAIVLNTTLW